MYLLTNTPGQPELQGDGKFPGPVPLPGPLGAYSDPDVHLVILSKGSSVDLQLRLLIISYFFRVTENFTHLCFLSILPFKEEMMVPGGRFTELVEVGVRSTSLLMRYLM